MVENDTDETLLRRMGRQDEVALQLLYARYSGAVYSLARRILRDESDAEEAVQDVFVKAWRGAGEYEVTRGAVSTWLLTIAHHATIDRVRRRNVRATVPVEEGQLEATPDRLDLSMVVVERVRVRGAVERLAASERLLIEAAFFEGLTHSQIASRTGLPLGTIKTRLRGALIQLRQHLKDQ